MLLGRFGLDSEINGESRDFKEEVTESDVFPEGICGHTGCLVSAVVEGIVEAVKLGRGEKTEKVKVGSPVLHEWLVLTGGGSIHPSSFPGES